MNDARRFWLMVVMAVWAVTWAGSFAVVALTEPTGDGFTRGLNRVGAFLGWQGIAGVLALTAWGMGRAWPPGSAVRRIATVPIALALLLAAAIAGLFLWAILGKP